MLFCSDVVIAVENGKVSLLVDKGEPAYLFPKTSNVVALQQITMVTVIFYCTDMFDMQRS